MKKTFLGLLSVFIIFGCSEDKTNLINITAASLKMSSWRPLATTNSVATLQVLNSLGQPIENSQVLIGSALGIPFENNLFVTNKNGMIENLTAWTTQEHITADAAGFVRQTLLSQNPGYIVIKLNTASLVNQSTITGQVTRLPVVNGDKNIDFGLVMAAMTRSDILNFDLDSVISPITDTMKVATSTVPVPTNVSLPKQQERYYFNLTVEKPQYRFFSPSIGHRQLFAAAGRFPFGTVVDELRSGKPFYDVINYFDLRGGGLRDVVMTGPVTTMDIPGDELAFTKPISIASPTLNAGEIFIALSASEISGFLIPTGIKKMAANTTAGLNALTNAPTLTINVIKKQSEFMAQTPGADRLSAALLPYSQNVKPTMLPLIGNPSVLNSNGYIVTLPALSNVTGVYPLAVSALISDIQKSGPADKPVLTLIRKWEILGTQWPAKIELPNWPLQINLQTTTQKHFEINYIGGLKNETVNLGDELINSATHVTHSSTDF